MSDNELEISIEDVDKRLEPVMKKKRIMTDLQKENLVKARARAMELRRALREKDPPVKKPKPLTKLEQRLLQKEEPTPLPNPEVPKPNPEPAKPKPEAPPKPEEPAPEAPKTKRWVLEHDINGNFQMIEKEF